MVFGLFEKKKTKESGIIKRVPIETIIYNLTNNYPASGEQCVSIEKTDLNKNLKAILKAQDLPFDIENSQTYILDERTGFVGGYLGHLIVGDSWVFLGSNWYGDGKAINSEFAFRENDLITLGYLNETCRITDDRKVETDIAKDRFQLELPEEYNPEDLFVSVPHGFTENLSRGNSSYSTLGPRSSIFHGRSLAGKKFR